MARSQIRLGALTGSLPDLVWSGSQSSAGNSAVVVANDLAGILGSFAGAIGRINGFTSTAANGFTGAALGIFKTDIKPEADGTRSLGGSGAEYAKLWSNAVESQGAFDLQAATAITIDSAGTNAIGIGTDTNTGPINIGTGAALRVITVGNISAATSVTLNAGTGGIGLASTGAGDITINSDDTLLLDSDGVLELNSSAGDISIGDNAVATQNLNLGTGAQTGTITIGDPAKTAVDVDALAVTVTSVNALSITDGAANLAYDGSGAVTLTSVAYDHNASGVITMDAGANAISIGSESAEAGAINIGTSTGARTIKVGNATLTNTTEVELNAALIDINAGASGLLMNAGAASNLTTSAGALTLVGAAGESVGTAGQTSAFAGSLSVAQDLIVNGTATYINTSELMVEDKVVVIGVPGGMAAPGTATYALTSDVVTVTSVGHGLLNTQWVLISDPAASPLIPEDVYQITSVADDDTFTFAYVRANVSSGTAIDHSLEQVTNATGNGAGFLVPQASVTETSLKWDSTNGWIISGPAGAPGQFAPRVDGVCDLGRTGAEWKDLYVDGVGYIDTLGSDGDPTTAYIGGGEIDSTVIGSEIPAAADFTTATTSGVLTVGSDANGADVTFHSATTGDYMKWDSANERLEIVGTSGQVALDIDTGNLTVGAYGLTDAGAATIASMAGNWTNVNRTVADMGIVTTIDLNGGTVDGVSIGTAAAATALSVATAGTTNVDITAGTVANADADIVLTAQDQIILEAKGTDAQDGVTVKVGAASANVGFQVIDSANEVQFIVDGIGAASINASLEVPAISSLADLKFSDQSRAGSTWSDAAGIKLSTNAASWSDFETSFGGEVSLLDAITSANGASAGASKTVGTLTAVIYKNVAVGAANKGMSTFSLANVARADRFKRVDVFVNGQLMHSGTQAAMIATTVDYALQDASSGTADANADLKFGFELKQDDVLQVLIK